ncbi:MAG: hypothetical protein A2Y24_02905 [Clostridiales bacterium GWE2_32_10]|nr:MAG: hypothetical protein A2Y24_02905 [Clostridiales bacterium GWE2_32_10]HBY19554.1 hypothetical protein [Clostridiales bacterium]
MIGRMLNTIITILFLTYVILLISFFFLHEVLKNNINEINYSILDTVATTGVFTDDIYEYLKKQVFLYGSETKYQVVIKYEKKVKPGTYDTYWKKDWIDFGELTNKNPDGSTKEDEILTIIGKPVPMHIGDKVSIYLEAQDQTLFVKLLNAPFFGMINQYTDMRIKSLKTVVVGRNAKSIVKGYELKAEIAKKNKEGWVTNIDITDNGMDDPQLCPVTINVKTEMDQKSGGTGYNYNISNPEYGNVSDLNEQYTGGNNLGKDYIFDTVEFYRQVTEYYPIPATGVLPAGKDMADYEKIVEFIQN